MKKSLTLLILLLIGQFYISQENWTLYPQNGHKDSSIKEEVNLSIVNESNKMNSKVDQLIDTSQLKYINDLGFLLISKDERIDSLNKYLAKTGTFKGFSVQICVSQETDKIRNTRKSFVENFPSEFLYDEYIAPNIFLYAGKYYTKHDAISFKKKLEPFFDNTMVIAKDFPLEFKIDK